MGIGVRDCRKVTIEGEWGWGWGVRGFYDQRMERRK